MRGRTTNPAEDGPALVAESLPVGEAAVRDDAQGNSGSQRGIKRVAADELRRGSRSEVIEIQVAARATVRIGLPATAAAREPKVVRSNHHSRGRRYAAPGGAAGIGGGGSGS